MITVEALKNDTIKVSFKYYEDYINRIKQVPGAHFDKDTKSWVIPKFSLIMLEEIFEGELYFKTPLWKIKGLPRPEYEIKLNVDYEVPKLSNGMKPFKYQEFTYNYMMNKLEENGFTLNTLSVGLGKTLTAIMCFKSLYDMFKANKLLILAKKSIKKQWCDEFKKFTDLDNRLDKIEYIGESATKKQRDKIYKEFSALKSGVLVTTYQSCLNDSDMLKEVGFDVVIIDEAHILKTVNGKINQSVKKSISKAKYKILLTGTPLTARPRDLYALISLCNDKYLGNFKDFSKRYIVSCNRGTYIEDVGVKHIEELRELTQNVLIRLTENEVDIDLPTIVESTIKLEMDDVQRKLLEILEVKQEECLTELEKLNKNVSEYRKKGWDTEKLLGRLSGVDATAKGLISSRQAIANDPLLLLMSRSKMIKSMFESEIPEKYKYSPKTEWLLNKVDEIVEEGNKVIIFSRFERSARLLGGMISKHLKKNALLFTGEVREEERNKNIDLFKTNDEFNILIGSESMAEGLNLDVSNHVIHYDQPDTLATKVQRIGRIRRASSIHKTGYSYDLIAENSVDEKVLEKLNNQGNLTGALTELNEEESVSFREVSN